MFGLFQSRGTKQFPCSGAQPAINCSTYPSLNQVALGGSTTPTVACLPHPPSPTQTDVPLVRRHAHPDQQPCDSALFVRGGFTKDHQAPTKTPQHSNSYFNEYCHSCTYRITAGDSSYACRGHTRACAVMLRYTSCSEGSICLRSICPAVTRSG